MKRRISVLASVTMCKRELKGEREFDMHERERAQRELWEIEKEWLEGEI